MMGEQSEHSINTVVIHDYVIMVGEHGEELQCLITLVTHDGVLMMGEHYTTFLVMH